MKRIRCYILYIEIKLVSKKLAAKILIIEDDEDIVDMYRDHLEKNYDLTVTHDFSGLLKILSEPDFNCDLALVDIILGQGNLIDEIKNSAYAEMFGGIQKIYVSGVDNIDVINSAYDTNAFDFISKPLRFNLLEYKIEKLLKQNSEIIINPLSLNASFGGNTSQPFTATELKIVCALKNFNCLSLSELAKEIWGENKPNQKIAVHISRARKKIKDLGLSIEHNAEKATYQLIKCNGAESQGTLT